MASFKKRTRAERRNRAKAKIGRQIRSYSSFGLGRNALRHLARITATSWFRNCIGDRYCDTIIGLIKQYRAA